MKSILIADDEETLRTLVRVTLEDPAYRILESGDGEEALTRVREECPDLVLLDWMMPGMSGIEVLEAMRDDPSTAAIPVVMLTARAGELARGRGMELGVAAYLTKPFSPLELISVVRSLLG
ncbi:response regulator [Endothiovibrio diazotrophicus]